LPDLSILLNTLTRHEVDAVEVWSVTHLGSSVDTLPDIFGDLDRYGVRLVAHDHADGEETGGLMAAADPLVVARRAYRTEAIRAGQLKARATGVRFGRPPMPSSCLERVRAALQCGQGEGRTARSTGLSAAKVCRTRAEMVGAGLMG
jgi:hypothetical protein